MSTSFSHYQIQAEIGRGGMGIVYRALDKRDNKTVAIKQLILDNVAPEKHKEFIERFAREAKTAAQLEHKNIVKVLEISDEEKSLYYVMEHLEGNSLRKTLATNRGKISPHSFFNILNQLSDGLSFAHSLNVVHRDIKPDNIFILNDGRVVITDFGIARIADLEATNITKTGVMLGTLAYVSPEQLQNAKKVDHRADIFSLGVLTYEALSGSLPFTGDGIAATIVKIMSHEEIPLHIKNNAICDELSSVVSKALRKHPKDRFRSVKEFLREYQTALQSQSQDQFENVEIDPLTTSIDVELKPSLLTTTAGPPDILEGEGKELDKKFSDVVQSDETVQSTSLSNFAREIKESDTSSVSKPEAPPKRRRLLRDREESPSRNITLKTTENDNATIGYNPIKPSFSIDTFDGENFVEPAVVAYRSGRIVVADIATRSGFIFSHDGRFISKLIQRPEMTNTNTGGGKLTKPSGIDIDERGKVYICDSSDQYIRIFDNQGSFLKEFKNIKGKSGGLQGITIDSTGLLYVSDSNNNSLQVFQSDMGVWVREVTKGNGKEEFKLPSGLTTDRLNKVYVVDYGTSQVSVFTKAGIHTRTFGRKGRENGMFNVPRALAVDKHDRIFVLDSLNHRIQVFSSSGDWIYTFGGLGKELGKFVGPSDMAIDNDNNVLFVADKGNKRIQVLELAFK